MTRVLLIWAALLVAAFAAGYGLTALYDRWAERREQR